MGKMLSYKLDKLLERLTLRSFGLIFVVILFAIGYGCNTPTTSTGKSVSSQDKNLTSDQKREKEEKQDEKRELDVSNSLKELVVSLSNNNYSSATINKQKIADYAQKLESKIMSDKKLLSDENYSSTLTTFIAAQRLSGANLSSILETSRKYIAIGMKKNVNKQLPAFSKLDVALAALKEKKLAMAEFFLNEIISDKEAPKEIKAGAYTALGMISLQEDRIPEAIELWKKALAQDSSYKAALFDIGFIATRYGDVKTANATLGKLDSDWYAMSGLIVTDRLAGNGDRISMMCNKVLGKNKNHKPALVSCGYYELQVNKDTKAAKEYANKAVTLMTGNFKLDDAADKLLLAIDDFAMQQASKPGKAKADDSKQDADKTKAKANSDSKSKAKPKAKPKAGADDEFDEFEDDFEDEF